MKQAFEPLKFAIILALGILIGIWFVPYKTSGGNKFAQIFQLVKNNYVDTINTETLEKESISDLLHSLDPHSNYFTAEESKQVNEPLEGSFEGIGIEFLVMSDTILVANIIDDGPSFKAGLKVGDRIIKVDDKLLQGLKLQNEDVLKLLKGKSGSIVKVGVCRGALDKVTDFSIIRGSVAIKSVDGYFMADNKTGCIKISRFAANTFDEYKTAFDALKNNGMENLIIDLRDNGGGYLNIAQKIADEFLESERIILTTKGEHTGNEIYKATSKGSFEKGKLIILVNENSASASEILGGALQDNDRALIIGRRTFGKGLVQNSFSMSDGSSIRLTISRYYTPCGRSIQRPYNHGYAYYEEDYQNRYNSGELFIEDSIKTNTDLVFNTLGGRRVYGGGGIVPDFFVHLDTSQRSRLLSELINKSVIREVAYSYAEQKKDQLRKYSDVIVFNDEFNIDNSIWQHLESVASKAQIIWNVNDFKHSKSEIERYLKAYISKQLYKSNGYYYSESLHDETMLKALSCMREEKYFEKLIR